MTDPLVSNAADVAAVNAGVREEKTEREQQIEDLLHVLDHRCGRRLLWKYLSNAGVFRSSYTGNVEGTIFNEGRRSMGNEIMADITDSKPESLIQMMQESRLEAEERQRSAAARAESDKQE